MKDPGSALCLPELAVPAKLMVRRIVEDLGATHWSGDG